uniref:Protein kinase domain-containing protein n=1 Tax=Oryza nivara TaxID=4536 RepID=A0A0E0FRB1_ORYNI
MWFDLLLFRRHAPGRERVQWRIPQIQTQTGSIGSCVVAPPAGEADQYTVLVSQYCISITLHTIYRRWLASGDGRLFVDHFDDDDDGEPIVEIEMGMGPRRFPYHELVDATKSFATEEKLGQGGFGAVYRGYLRELGLAVAIKRFAKDSSKQGRKEYKSEIKVISRLRHRNLVQLIGWCHGRTELLLVYELVPIRSLDVHLHGNGTFLTWPMRINIVHGLGSALLYLHEEWDQCVVHRDIKPSNVMLDESFNAKLGDFGLARLIDHAVGVQTMTHPSGTPGYLDPECVITGKASAESDVYSFGVVLLEVACGRRPMSLLDNQNNSLFRLVEWVWDLYGQGVVLKAADERLNNDYDATSMECVMAVGLWCVHPDRYARPSIRAAMTVLQSNGPLPVLPSKMPVPTYAPPMASSEGQLSSSTGMSSSSITLLKFRTIYLNLQNTFDTLWFIHVASIVGSHFVKQPAINIVHGLGSALLYLHEEWDQCVVHRDIKPSNVMLDESFNAKLGDFGLARLIDHAVGIQTMTHPSGTPGYLDPECVITGKASAESDVYSFGIVLLEVACGRRPISLQDTQNNCLFRLVEWVWDLYGQGAVLNAADERLNNEYDTTSMECVMAVGLCRYPSPYRGPGNVGVNNRSQFAEYFGYTAAMLSFRQATSVTKIGELELLVQFRTGHLLQSSLPRGRTKS